VDIEELSDEVQFSVKDNPTEKRDKEWQEEAFKAGEVLIEGFDGIFHVVLYELKKLCMEEFFEEMFRCFLSEEKDKEEADNEK
jgi:hypothetical protein